MYLTHLLVLTWATRPASSVCNKYNIIQYNISIILYNIAPVGLDLGDEARQLRKQRPDHAVEGLRVRECVCVRARACVRACACGCVSTLHYARRIHAVHHMP